MSTLRRNDGSFLFALLLGAAALAGPASAGGSLKDVNAAPTPTQGVVSFTGFDSVKNSDYVYDGLIVAWNHDLSRDGFLIRAYGGFVNYHYHLDDVQGGRVNGDGWQGDLMLGYQWHRPNWTFAAYIGGDYQTYKLTPDDTAAKMRGDEFGFKVAADLETNGTPVYFNLSGDYSTAFDTYWSRVRLGYNFNNRLTLGPEGIAFGGDGYDAQRVGAFGTFTVHLTPTAPVEVTLSGGHQFARDNNNANISGGRGGDSGVYGAVNFGFTF